MNKHRSNLTIAKHLCTILLLAIFAGRAQSQTLALSDDGYSNFANSSLTARSEFRFLAPPPQPTNPFAKRNATAARLKLTAMTLAAFPNITGNGTPGNIPYFTAGTVIRDSIIFQSKQNNIGIGTTAPGSKLTVGGMIESLSGGFRFPDGTVQTSSAANALFSVAHDETLAGDGTNGSPLGVAVPLILTGSVDNGDGIITATNTAVGGPGIVAEGGPANSIIGGGTGLVSVGGSGGSNIPGGVGVIGRGGLNSMGPGGAGASLIGGDSADGRGGDGAFAIGGDGVGMGNSGGRGIVAISGLGTGGGTRGLAGDFLGDVEIEGDFSVIAGTKNFKIDHPLDPENKYLYHAAIESSEVLNVYSGNVRLDANGEATVNLPEWFEALNNDYRYSLTSIGAPGQGLYIAEEVSNNQFRIAGGLPGAKISWQVTGIRSDAVMRKRTFKAETDKPERERGTYLSPEAFGQPEERGVKWVRNPEMMQQMKETRLKQIEEAKQQAQSNNR